MGRPRKRTLEDKIEVYDLERPSKKSKDTKEITSIDEGNEEQDQRTAPSTPVLRRSKRLSNVVQIEDTKSESLQLQETIFPTPPASNKRRGRRSTKKDQMLDDQTSSPSLPKARPNYKPITAPVEQPTILSLPKLVLEHLFGLLDVSTLETLGKTCSFFDAAINGVFLTSLSVPFDENFIGELGNTRVIEKKPLLKLVSSKSHVAFTIQKHLSIHNVIFESKTETTEYLLQNQLSLLQLDHLRELDMLPENIHQGLLQPIHHTPKLYETYRIFDSSLLGLLQTSNSLVNLSKLSILVDTTFFLDGYMKFMPNLQELNLAIISKTGMSKYSFVSEYLARLEYFVSTLTTPVLKLHVLSETKRQVPKVFVNDNIKSLQIKGPCTLNIFPIMKNLQELDIKLDTASQNVDCCTYFKSKADDRKSHRPGLCVVNVGAIFENCPNLEKFMGIDLKGVVDKKSKKDKDITFSKWNMRVKKLFYEDYMKQGGKLEIKKWSKVRWLTKRPIVPAEIGRERVVQQLQELFFNL